MGQTTEPVNMPVTFYLHLAESIGKNSVSKLSFQREVNSGNNKLMRPEVRGLPPYIPVSYLIS